MENGQTLKLPYLLKSLRLYDAQGMDILSSLFDNLDEALVILDGEGKILLFNEVALKLSKTILLEPVKEGSNIADLTDIKTSLFIREIIQEIRQKGTPERYFTEVTNANGVRLSLEFNLIPVINNEGVGTHIHVLIRDHTSQKVFEKKLVTQANYITNLIEKANAIIMGVDTRGYITDWNEHSVKTMGFTKDEVYGQKFTNVLLKDLTPENFDQILLNGLNQEMLGPCELPIRVRNGSLITLLLGATPRLSVSGDVIGLTLVGQDVTELTEYRVDLEKIVEKRTHELHAALEKEKELVEMKSKFVSMASHEFRTPLSTISLASGFIKKFKERMTPEEINKKLVSVETQVTHMTTLLDDILTMGKGEAGKIEVNWITVPVRFFFENLVQEVVESHQRSHRVNLKINSVFEHFQTDEGLIRNILINLLNNAIKFSPKQDEIELTITGSKTEIVFRVRDNGIGISPEDVPKLFQPFYRASNATTISGTGLGLTILKKAVNLLGGKIEVTSFVGRGTEFFVTLPIKNEKEE